MAEFVASTDRTGGDWKGTYGSKGYVIAGVEPNVPKDARFAFSTEIKKQELRWPEGVAVSLTACGLIACRQRSDSAR